MTLRVHDDCVVILHLLFFLLSTGKISEAIERPLRRYVIVNFEFKIELAFFGLPLNSFLSMSTIFEPRHMFYLID